jgi:hypothetical protein
MESCARTGSSSLLDLLPNFSREKIMTVDQVLVPLGGIFETFAAYMASVRGLTSTEKPSSIGQVRNKIKTH